MSKPASKAPDKKKKSSSSRATSSTKKHSSPKGQPLTPRQREIIGIAMITVALLLLFCLIQAPEEGESSGAMGAVSLLLLRLMGFLAGSGALTIPFFLALYGLSLLRGRHNSQSEPRFIGLLLTWAAFLGIFSLSQPLSGFLEYMAQASSGQGPGGGFIGGFLAYLLQLAFGSVGSLIVLLALGIIGLLIFTDKSLPELLSPLTSGLAALFKRLRTSSLARQAAQPQQENPSPSPTPQHEEKRHQPLIISNDDPAPLISEAPPEPPAPPKPALTRFAAEFLPSIDGKQEPEAKPAKGRKGKSGEEAPKEAKTQGIVKEAAPSPAPAQQGKSRQAAPAEDKKPPTIIINGQAEQPPYQLPPIELIEAGVKVKNPRLNKAITDSIALLETSLGNFGVKATVTQVVSGPAVTRYELQPAPGVKVARIVSLSDDIALALAATAVRIEAPIPGKSAIGIEVARDQIDTVYFREVMESPEFSASESKLSFALGKNIAGESIVGDLSKMPHLLIAGSTGSGKSICVNSILCSILYKAKPNEVKLMLIDPKKVEMSHYNSLPHLVAPVVTDSKKAANALKWVVNEMENRYTLFVGAAVKDFASYNLANPEEPLPQIVVVIDELADLMMVAKHDVEDAICRIAQMARAAGIYLLVATQRPSVDVITGLIKANIPSRIAFAVSSYTDSRTILDMGGAEKLLGRGDMLYAPIGVNKPLRVQGSFMKEADIIKLVEYCKAQAAPRFVEAAVEAASSEVTAERLDDVDELFFEAGSVIIGSGQASTSFLQRRLSIGNPRAARLIDQLAEKGVVGGPKGAKPRDILMSMEEFANAYGDAG